MGVKEEVSEAYMDSGFVVLKGLGHNLRSFVVLFSWIHYCSKVNTFI